MKIIFDSEEQMHNFFTNVICPGEIDEDWPWMMSPDCARSIDENAIKTCTECWKKCVEFEVKDNEQKS